MTDETKSTLLKLDEEYHKLIEKFRTKYVAQTCVNIRDEFDKFMKARENGQKYYPQLEIENSEVDMKLYDKMEKLMKDFEKIKDTCYISKFYIEKLHSMRLSLELRKKLEDGEYEPGENPVDKKLYQDALDCLKKNPYHKPDFKNDRVIDSEQCKDDIEDALDDLGFDFDVHIKSGMLPRMNVKMGDVNINKTSRLCLKNQLLENSSPNQN